MTKTARLGTLTVTRRNASVLRKHEWTMSEIGFFNFFVIWFATTTTSTPSLHHFFILFLQCELFLIFKVLKDPETAPVGFNVFRHFEIGDTFRWILLAELPKFP